MKIRLWFHIKDNGDGSAGVNIFKTQDEAQASADEEMETCGQALCDNVFYEDIDTNDFEVVD